MPLPGRAGPACCAGPSGCVPAPAPKRSPGPAGMGPVGCSRFQRDSTVQHDDPPLSITSSSSTLANAHW